MLIESVLAAIPRHKDSGSEIHGQKLVFTIPGLFEEDMFSHPLLFS